MGLHRLALVLGLIVLAAASRLLPHPPNVAPIAALALLGGASLRLPWSLALPAAAMFFSDLFLGFASPPITAAVYGSFLLTVALGTWVRSRPSPWKILGSTLAASILFYLVTNAAVWGFSDLYPRTLNGLLLSYTYAIPFFRHTMLGDMTYGFVLLSAYHYAPEAMASLLRNVRALRYLRHRRAPDREHSVAQ